MAEAFQWFGSYEICKSICFYNYKKGSVFKSDLTENKIKNRIDDFDREDISFTISQYLAKVTCLNGSEMAYSIEQAKNNSSTKTIFENQLSRFIDPKNK